MVLLVFFTACGPTMSEEGEVNITEAVHDTGVHAQTVNSNSDSQPEDTTDYEHATFFVLVADTGPNYYVLHKKMFDMHRQLSIPIDTMGRLYNQEKNLIALPDDDDDEMYAGNYFPRRFPSDNLSLEYLDFYQRNSDEKTIALIAGIYQTEEAADKAFAGLRKAEKNAFKIKADMFIGCMH